MSKNIHSLPYDILEKINKYYGYIYDKQSFLTFNK